MELMADIDKEKFTVDKWNDFCGKNVIVICTKSEVEGRVKLKAVSRAYLLGDRGCR